MTRGLSKAVVLVCGALAGCAHVRVSPVDPRGSAEGLRFYRPWPYLLVTAEAADPGPAKYKAQVVWLPRTNAEYAVEVKPGWGSANGTVKLHDGWNVVELGASSDSKIPETITAVSGFLTAVGGLGAQGLDNRVQGALEPGLYRFIFDSDGYVTSLQPVQAGSAAPIQQAIPPAPRQNPPQTP